MDGEFYNFILIYILNENLSPVSEKSKEFLKRLN